MSTTFLYVDGKTSRLKKVKFIFSNKAMQLKISAKLKEVMMSVDLDEATSKSVS